MSMGLCPTRASRAREPRYKIPYTVFVFHFLIQLLLLPCLTFIKLAKSIEAIERTHRKFQFDLPVCSISGTNPRSNRTIDF